MTKERLHAFKNVTTWGGVLVTFSGILFGIVHGGSWQAGSISLSGLAITCLGHWITNALSKHQKAEKIEDEKRIADLLDRVESAEACLDDPDLKRLTERERSDYIIEHQDDGK